MHSLCVCYVSITEMNSTDRLSTSIVDKKTDTSSGTAQYRSVPVARVRVTILYASLARLIVCMNVTVCGVLYIAYMGLRKPKEHMHEVRPAILVVSRASPSPREGRVWSTSHHGFVSVCHDFLGVLTTNDAHLRVVARAIAIYISTCCARILY